MDHNGFVTLEMSYIRIWTSTLIYSLINDPNRLWASRHIDESGIKFSRFSSMAMGKREARYRG